MKREDCLKEAANLITGARQADYGDAKDSFGRIATLWSAYLAAKIEPHDVAAMMVLLKVSRAVESPKKVDTWIDMAGYAALAGELSDADS